MKGLFLFCLGVLVATLLLRVLIGDKVLVDENRYRKLQETPADTIRIMETIPSNTIVLDTQITHFGNHKGSHISDTTYKITLAIETKNIAEKVLIEKQLQKVAQKFHLKK